MRRRLAVGALLVVMTTSCADEARDPGSLIIRCPDSRGAIGVNDGQVLIAGVPIRIAAELRGASSLDEGMSYTIEVHGPSVPTDPTISVQCVRMRVADENMQWDAVPRRIDEVYRDSSARIRASGRDGPHWRSDKVVEVTVWLKIGSGRHVLTLAGQPIHAAP